MYRDEILIREEKMYKLSEIIGKSVIGTFEAKNVGTLMNALFDRGFSKLRWFEVLGDDETDAERTYFEPPAVSAMDGDAIMLKNCGKLTGRFSLAPVFVSAPVNAAVYSPTGKALGRVTDVTLDGFTVTAINVGDLAFSPDAVLSRSDDVMIVNDTGEKIRLIPPKVKVPEPSEADNATVAINAAETENPADESAPAAVKVTAMPKVKTEPAPDTQTAEPGEKIGLPGKVPYSNVSVTKSPATRDARLAGYAFLIGKLVTKTLTSEDGEIVVEAGGRVTESDLKRTEQAGKLVQLALHTK